MKSVKTVKAANARIATEKWGMHITDIERARLAGCVAFRNNGIYRHDLEQWIEANPKSDGSSLDKVMDMKARRLQAQVDKLEIENAMRRDLLVSKNEVQELWGRIITDIFNIIDKSVDRLTYNAIAKEVKTRIAAAS